METFSVERACYFAGFLDGDGSILAQIIRRKDYVNLFQIRVSITFVQKMKRIHFLRTFQSEIGVGTVRDRNDGVAELEIVGHTNVYAFLKQIVPFLRIKRKQANLVIRICEQFHLTKENPYKFLELCDLADQVAQLNDSKTRIFSREIVEKVLIDSGKIKK